MRGAPWGSRHGGPHTQRAALPPAADASLADGEEHSREAPRGLSLAGYTLQTAGLWKAYLEGLCFLNLL